MRVRNRIQMHNTQFTRISTAAVAVRVCVCVFVDDYVRVRVVVGYCEPTAKTRAIYSCIELSRVLSNFVANTLSLMCATSTAIWHAGNFYKSSMNPMFLCVSNEFMHFRCFYLKLQSFLGIYSALLFKVIQNYVQYS